VVHKEEEMFNGMINWKKYTSIADNLSTPAPRFGAGFFIPAVNF